MAVFKDLFKDWYQLNGIIFVVIGIAFLLRYDGYKHLNTEALFTALLISFGYILYDGPCSEKVKHATIVCDLLLLIWYNFNRNSNNNLLQLIQLSCFIVLAFCFIAVTNDVFKLF